MKTDAYKKDHAELLEAVGKIQGLLSDIPTNAPEIVNVLATMSAGLKMHLAKEDQILYPALLNSSDENAKKTASKFQKEMGGIQSAWGEFISSWRRADKVVENADQFKSELNGIIKAVGARIETEENILYPMYDEVG